MVGSAETATDASAAAPATQPADTGSSSSVRDPADATGSNAANTGGDVMQDWDRLRTGVLLTNTAAASEEAVFGTFKGGAAAAVHAYKEHAKGELLVIHRQQDDAAAHPFKWYKPWSWWSSGPRVSPILQRPASALPYDAESARLASGHRSPATAASMGTSTQTEETSMPPAPPASVAATAAAVVKRKKKKGQPTVDMRPLTEAEVDSLTPAVQEDRMKVLRAEEHIHKTLQSIEDTRYRYLVPSQDLRCEAEVNAVVQCYTKRNQAAAAERAKALASSAASADDAQRRGTAVEKPVVRMDLLACGADVQRLKKCADAMVVTYSREGEIA